MPVNIENQKLNLIKSFYNNSKHVKLYGPRVIFDDSIYREINVTGKKLISFIELKQIKPGVCITNIGINIAELYRYSTSPKSYSFIYNNVIPFIEQVRTDPNLQFIKVLYYSPHNSFLPYVSNILINHGFIPVITKSEISLNKLIIDGIHANYKLILRK